MSETYAPSGRIRRDDKGRFEGRLTRTYEGHDRSQLWEMLTQPAKMAQWLAAGTIEQRTGGRAHIDFQDSGIVIDSEVLECDPQRCLAYSWSSGTEPQRPLRWQLDDAPGGVQLTLTVTIPAEEDPAKACGGFEGHLEMLGAALEGVSIKFPVALYLDARKAYGAQVEALS